MAAERPISIFLSAGEASGDLYASELALELLRRRPDLRLFGCAGPRMRAAGVRALVRAESLAVVGLVEVVAHIPRIYREFRKLLAAARREPPAVAVLTDSPDFHLRLARKLHTLGVPVVYLVAPQVWAWRKDRLTLMRRVLTRLLCIFPFEEKFFLEHGVAARYIGHPLTRRIRASTGREEFFREFGLTPGVPLVVLLPGSRRGEALRHLDDLVGAAALLRAKGPVQFVLPASPNTGKAFFDEHIFRERKTFSAIQVIEGSSWDAIAHADVALAASGTVTVECALLGTPLVTFYKVSKLSWYLGKLLVRVPFYSMVNLIAARRLAPELMQSECTAGRLAAEARHLLDDAGAREAMLSGLAEVRAALRSDRDPIAAAADEVMQILELVEANGATN